MRTRTKVVGLVSAAALLLSAQAGAVKIVGGTLDGTDVGNIDEFVASTGVLAGDQAQADFINTQLATGFTKDDLAKTENVKWHNTDVMSVIAFALASGPGHYLVKNAQVTILVTNVFDFNWGVINISGLNLNLGSDMKISHVTEAGEPTTEVPEPGTLALLGIAAIGLGLVRRRRLG